MKHRTAMVSAMSIAGVVLAGATALGANLTILKGTSDTAGELTAVTDTTASPETTSTTASDLTAYQLDGVGTVVVERDGDMLSLADVQFAQPWQYTVRSTGALLDMSFTLPESPDPNNADQVLPGREVIFQAAVQNGQIMVGATEGQLQVAVAETGTLSSGSGGSSGTHGSSTSSSSQPAPTTATTMATTTTTSHHDDEGEDHGSTTATTMATTSTTVGSTTTTEYHGDDDCVETYDHACEDKPGGGDDD